MVCCSGTSRPRASGEINTVSGDDDWSSSSTESHTVNLTLTGSALTSSGRLMRGNAFLGSHAARVVGLLELSWRQQLRRGAKAQHMAATSRD